jgi:enoyl-CoA hydratase/carnithine racemase
MTDLVTCEMDEGVADLALNRPEKLNALSDELFVELHDAVTQLAGDPALRAVVLSGNGRGFCAGLDLSTFQRFAAQSEAGESPMAPPEPGSNSRGPGRGQGIVRTLLGLPVPVIAAIQGPAVGGGLQIALGADLRFVRPDAKLALREITFGITPDMGGTQLLPRMIGYERALDLIVTGRFVTGEEAVAIGLASRVCEDPKADALAFAAEIAAKSPTAVRLCKELVGMSRTDPLSAGLAAEVRVLASNLGSPNQVEAVHAYFEKRAPVFADPEVGASGAG